MNIDTKVYRKHETPTFGNTLLGAGLVKRFKNGKFIFLFIK